MHQVPMTMSSPWIFLLLFVSIGCLTWVAENKKVVIIPMPCTSHTRLQINVARAVAKLGHEVWLAVPDYLAMRNTLDTSGFTVIQYATKKDYEKSGISPLMDSYSKGNNIGTWLTVAEEWRQFCDELLRDEDFFQTLKDIRPDLVVIDSVVLIKMLAIIPYRLGSRFAFVGSHYDSICVRVPFSPAISPAILLPFSQNMTFSQRVLTFVVYVLYTFFDINVYPDAVSRYAPEMPYMPIDIVVQKAEIWLVDMDHILDYPRSTMPHMKFIGGMTTGPAKPLPPDLQSFMDSATQGVVIVSFGSYFNLPSDISDKVFSVLKQLPMKSVFKSNLTSPDPQKILTSPWIPQNDLLGHPNTKLLVSHCGKSSQYEALYHAAPVVATPMISDQYYNAERLRVKGFSETVDIRSVSTEELKATIEQVAHEPRYKKAITIASRLFRQQAGVPADEAAYWLDHVMEYGGEYMRSAGLDMPYYQFLMLDVIAFLFVVLMLFLCLLCLLSYTVCRRCFRRKMKSE